MSSFIEVCHLDSHEYCHPSNIIFFPRFFFVKVCLPSKVVFNQNASSIYGHLPSIDVFHRHLSFFEDCPHLNINFHWKVSSIEGYFQFFNFKWRSSSLKGCLSLRVIYHSWLSSIDVHLPSRMSSIKRHILPRVSFIWGCFPLKVILHQRSSATRGPLQYKVVFNWRWSSIGAWLPLEFVFNWLLFSLGGPLWLGAVFHQM